ncbi:MAG: hypothetical protein ABSC06_31990 [Rhodopila sp.]
MVGSLRSDRTGGKITALGHRAALDALRRRDPSRAEAAMRADSTVTTVAVAADRRKKG